MTGDFFRKKYSDGHNRYCLGFKSFVAREILEIGTQYGEPQKGISYGLSSSFLNALEKMPVSTQNMIVVPWKAEEGFDYETSSYDKLTFNADVVDYKLSLEEFDAVINDLKRNEYWIPQYTFPSSLMGGMLIVPLVLMLIWGIVIGHGIDQSHPVIFLLIAIICPLLSLANFLSPWFVYRANLSRLEYREEAFTSILNSWNGRVFTDRKVNWKSGKYGCWLEIRFEKDIKGLENFNQRMRERVLDDLQEEYEEDAKAAGINVDGMRVGVGSKGCGNRRTLPNGMNANHTGLDGPVDSSKVGHAYPVKNIRTKKAGGDDLEIQDVNLGRPLLLNQN